jgi:hypothetical protein
MKKPVLGAFLNGVPDVENLFPILSDLHARGDVEVRVFVTSGLWWREPRVREVLKASGVKMLLRHNRLMKMPWYYKRLLRDVDAMLVIGDPKIDTSIFGKRSAAMIPLGKPTFWMQHGVIQNKIAQTLDGAVTDFYSDPIFYWVDPSHHSVELAPGVVERIRVCGFVKRPILRVKTPGAAFTNELARYRKRVLLCHTFRGGEYDADQINWAYDMIRDYCHKNPDVAVIVRPHRGKERANYNAHDKALAKDCKNAYFSLQHRGPRKGMNMNDVLNLSDCLISTASTAILDGLYMGKPAAMIVNDRPQLATLPEITDVESLTAFIEGGFTAPMQEMVELYGDLDRNIAFVCREIEAALGVTQG